MGRGRRRAPLDDLDDDEFDALLARPTESPTWLRGLLLSVVLVGWLVLSMGVVNSLVLAPLGCVLLVVLAVARSRGRRVGAWLAVIAVGTAWSAVVLAVVLLPSGSSRSVPTVAARPGDLTGDLQISVDRAGLEFFEAAYRERDLERYRQHVIGRPDPSTLAGCWFEGAVRASPSDRTVTKRFGPQANGVIDVGLAFIVEDAVYHAQLEVTADGWQVVEVDRVPGYEACPSGFPLPPAPPPAPSAG